MRFELEISHPTFNDVEWNLFCKARTGETKAAQEFFEQVFLPIAYKRASHRLRSGYYRWLFELDKFKQTPGTPPVNPLMGLYGALSVGTRDFFSRWIKRPSVKKAERDGFVRIVFWGVREALKDAKRKAPKEKARKYREIQHKHYDPDKQQYLSILVDLSEEAKDGASPKWEFDQTEADIGQDENLAVYRLNGKALAELTNRDREIVCGLYAYILDNPHSSKYGVKKAFAESAGIKQSQLSRALRNYHELIPKPIRHRFRCLLVKQVVYFPLSNGCRKRLTLWRRLRDPEVELAKHIDGDCGRKCRVCASREPVELPIAIPEAPSIEEPIVNLEIEPAYYVSETGRR